MPVTAIVGAQWGDVGKGKITDLLAEAADLVIRFGGGSNAGHTVINGLGEFKLHLLPSGIFNAAAISLLGTGMVVDFAALQRELDDLRRAGVSGSGLRISNRAQVVMPYHIVLDRLLDEARGEERVGTTQRGIGPAYADKVARLGIQTGDILFPDVVRRKLDLLLPETNRTLLRLGHPAIDPADIMRQAGEWRECFGTLLVDQVELVDRYLTEQRPIVLEGQLGAMRDIDWGEYPYVTSSTTIAGGGAVGGGVPPAAIDRVVGVVKAYTTAVGTGPMPTELHGVEADDLRTKGAEFGATTGRPRRVGWFDGPAACYARRLNGFTDMAVTKLDVLSGLESIPICVAYDVAGRASSDMPVTPLLRDAEPVFESVPGWEADISDIRSWFDLPSEARFYLSRLEELVGAKAGIVSVGPHRAQTILR